MKEKFVFILSFIVISAGAGFAQKPKPTPKPKVVQSNVTTVVAQPPSGSEASFPQAPIPADLPTILQKADEQTANYQEEFKNLLGEETKTFVTFDKNGKSKKQTIVESNFIVYQSAKNAADVTEYRNVVKVNGKTVGDSEKRATDLFTHLATSATAQKEFEEIQKESLRYDKTLDINGFTLFQARVFAEHIRPFFDFNLAGEETIEGSEVYVIAYQQKTKSPYVIFNDDQKKPEKFSFSYEVDVPNTIKEPNALLRGKIWVDKKTFQIRRERRELTIQPADLATPLVVNETELEYQPSDLGILTPRQIIYTDYNVKTKDKGKTISAVLDTKATFVYTKFTKSEVDVKSGDVKN